jgi:hypothetical protein
MPIEIQEKRNPTRSKFRINFPNKFLFHQKLHFLLLKVLPRERKETKEEKKRKENSRKQEHQKKDSINLQKSPKKTKQTQQP